MTDSTAPSQQQARARLMARLDELGFEPVVVDYPAHRTVEEAKRRRGDMTGTFTKNLLLKDKKNGLFLVAVHEDTPVDLRTLHRDIGARGWLGFASAEVMVDLLGVGPGAVTPLALMNDLDGAVTAVIDARILEAEQINFHPMTHTESIGVTPRQLQTFLEACAHRPVVVTLPAADQATE